MCVSLKLLRASPLKHLAGVYWVIRVESLSLVLQGHYSNNTKPPLLPNYYSSSNKMTHGLSSWRLSHRCVGTSLFMSSCFPKGLDTDALKWAETHLLKLISFHFRLKTVKKKGRSESLKCSLHCVCDCTRPILPHCCSCMCTHVTEAMI